MLCLMNVSLVGRWTWLSQCFSASLHTSLGHTFLANQRIFLAGISVPLSLIFLTFSSLIFIFQQFQFFGRRRISSNLIRTQIQIFQRRNELPRPAFIKFNTTRILIS
ncbi:hypothetical protein O6H91_18G006000 [Diphasiastrum complanatum]|uniref:Uncharacterized protein n=1 Tax=Diphasiastrum complanatum TaxID=34168 RepID=A0ACC2AXZ8_DIPCM|nr:hypothetical protein O6H91_18G006000 [Diphasiastrum complanatum]